MFSGFGILSEVLRREPHEQVATREVEQQTVCFVKAGLDRVQFLIAILKGEFINSTSYIFRSVDDNVHRPPRQIIATRGLSVIVPKGFLRRSD